MKLALLISVLVASCHASFWLVPSRRDIQVRVHGTLTCSTPFYYKVRLIERDDFLWDEFIATTEVSWANKTGGYVISGTASDFVPWVVWWRVNLEPRLIIHHTCQTHQSCYKIEDYCCVCKDWKSNVDLNEEVNVDLEKTTLERCSNCKILEDRLNHKWTFPTQAVQK